MPREPAQNVSGMGIVYDMVLNLKGYFSELAHSPLQRGSASPCWRNRGAYSTTTPQHVALRSHYSTAPDKKPVFLYVKQSGVTRSKNLPAF